MEIFKVIILNFVIIQSFTVDNLGYIKMSKIRVPQRH